MKKGLKTSEEIKKLRILRLKKQTLTRYSKKIKQ